MCVFKDGLDSFLILHQGAAVTVGLITCYMTDLGSYEGGFIFVLKLRVKVCHSSTNRRTLVSASFSNQLNEFLSFSLAEYLTPSHYNLFLVSLLLCLTVISTAKSFGLLTFMVLVNRVHCG